MSSGTINRICLLNLYRSCFHNKMQHISRNVCTIQSRGLHCLCKVNRDSSLDPDRNSQCVQDLLVSCVRQDLHRVRGILRPAGQPVINPVKSLQQFMGKSELCHGENLLFTYAKSKAQISCVVTTQLITDQLLCFRYIDSTVPLLPALFMLNQV